MNNAEDFRPKEWYGRGRLPHYDDCWSMQFLTMRLADSVPMKVIERWQRELEGLGEKGKIKMQKRIESYLDRGYGDCHLGKRGIAEMVRDSLFFHDGDKYRLISWVIMPNHLHFLLRQSEGTELEEITHSLKSYTAQQANKVLGRRGEFWQAETFDRFIRDGNHYRNTIRYIENNPVKARLCAAKEDWEFGSAWNGQ